MNPTVEDCITTVDLLRHGSCEGGEIYRGTTDVGLNEKGWQQMERALDGEQHWQNIITSPLMRCRAFAQDRAKRLDVPLQVDTGFREMSFGDWEGRSIQEVWKQDADRVSRFYENPEKAPPPGGEPCAEVRARVAASWQAILTKFAGQQLLLVGHGGVIRHLLSDILQIPLSATMRLHVPYAGRTRVRIYHGSHGLFPVVMQLNAQTGEI